MTELQPNGERRYRLLTVTTRLNIGGPTLQSVILTRGLPALGYDTVLAAGECEQGEGDMSYLLEADDSVRWIGGLSRSIAPLRNLRALRQLTGLMRRERFDIVHTHTAMAGCLGRLAAFVAGVPVVVHTFHGNSLRGYFRPAASAVFLAIERLLARRTDAICVLSAQQLDELSADLRVASRDKFRVMPLGLDLALFLAMAPPAPPAGLLRVGWFGRLVDVKNVPLLLDIAASARASGLACEFHIAGDGEHRELVEAALPRLSPYLIWHGWQRDVTHVLSQCHVVLQTSRNEGTPAALIQAMAAGRPFLSTAAGGVVDMTSGEPGHDAGAVWFENGILADPEPAAFVRVLAQLCAHPEKIADMGRAARHFASARYQRATLLANLDKLFRELLEAKASSRRRGSRTALPGTRKS
jgi:glycosyltransferase involved in cell wall biosynthesis